MKDFGKMMQQAKRLQENMKKMQEEVAKMEVTGESGAGMVRVTVTGDHQVRRIEIDPSLFAPSEKEMTEDLVAAACNQAFARVNELSAEKQKSAMAGIPLPPGFSF